MMSTGRAGRGRSGRASGAQNVTVTRVRIAFITAAFVVTGCASPQPTPTMEGPPSSATPTPMPTPTQSPMPEPASEPILPPITEAAALLPDGFTVVSEYDNSAPGGGMTSHRMVAAGSFIEAVFACEGRGRIGITLEDASAPIPSPGFPDERTLGALETGCSTVPEVLTLPGPDHDAAIGTVVRAPEGARYWVVVAAPTEDVRS
jgi:hypothetical protein